MSVLKDILKSKTEELPLPDRIYTELLRDILTDVVPKDSRLSEPEICKKYSASRTPVREAFRRLEMDGLVEYIPNRGEFVRGLTKEEIDDMLISRINLEARIAARAATRITDEQMEELKDIFNFMEFYTKKNDIRRMKDINMAFHCMVYKASRDKLMERTLISYHDYTDYCCPENYFAQGYLTKVLEEHRKVFRAIMNKDGSGAYKAMKTHMTRTVKRCNPKLKIEEYE